MYTKYKLGEITFEKALKCSLPTINSIIAKNKYYARNFDDYRQEGSIVLLDCLNSYKDCHNHSFSTYLHNKLVWRFIRYSWNDSMIRKPNYLYDNDIDRTRIEISTDKVKVVKNREDYLSIIDMFDCDSGLEDRVVSKVDSLSKLKLLKKEEVEILKYVTNGYTYEEIGKKMKCTKAFIWNKLQLMKDKINNPRFTNEEIKFLEDNIDLPEKFLSKELKKHLRCVQDEIQALKYWRGIINAK